MMLLEAFFMLSTMMTLMVVTKLTVPQLVIIYQLQPKIHSTTDH